MTARIATAMSGRPISRRRRDTAQQVGQRVTSADDSTGPDRLQPSPVPGPYTADLVNRRPVGCLVEIVETLVLTLVIFLVIQNFIAQPYRVQQQSMEQTLEPEQYVLVDKLTPRFDQYHRGDIVVFTPPSAWAQSSDGTPYIKRIIGVGGDTVEVKDDGFAYVNGVKLQEPYLFAVAEEAQPTIA